MDFFEAQDQARKGTSKLIVLFVLAVLGTIIALNAVAAGVLYATAGQEGVQMDPVDRLWRPGIYAAISVITVLVIGGASLFKTAQLHGDGGKVARMLGGRKLDPATDDPDERKLLNVVEEMSIASGVPVPDCYVMDREMGINAFAAGTDLENAAVGVTRGTIQKLSRDELQGVIAHEFSHILNGDMKINLRLIGVIFGILVIGLLGYTIFRYAPYMMQSRSRSSNDKGGNVGIFLLIVGGLVWLIGSVGVFFGRLIQASVSRQREYLADASAVQFTRNPHGIRDALRKIGGSMEKATLHTPHAGECSHLFFADGFSSMFATHPPLPKRISAIDPQWDGSMLKAEGLSEQDAREHAARQKASRPQRRFGRFDEMMGGNRRGSDNPIASLLGAVAGAAVETDPTQSVRQRGGTRTSDVRLRAEAVTNRVGQLDQEHIEFAGLMAQAIPPQLRAAARRPELARGLVAALFMHHNRSIRVMQDDLLAQRDPEAAQAADALGDVVADLGGAARLPLLDLCAPALRQLDERESQRFLETLRSLIEADERVEPFEYALYKLADRLVRRDSPRARYTSIDQVAEASQTMLSALAAAGNPNRAKQEQAYKAGVKQIRQGHLAFEPNFQLADLDDSLNRLAQAQMPVKRELIEAASRTVAADGVVTVEEGELLRAVAAVLGCPLPPFIDPAKPGKAR